MAAGGATDCNGKTIVPFVKELKLLELDHRKYKTFGITCRSMSVAWRRVRAATLDHSGALLPNNAFPFKP
tara:strand:- start:367 stop:576 length:210 start_codon:yes stop_codon:yes gene_type:complete